MTSHDYFDDLGADRQTLFWAAAARRELDCWEAAVALHTKYTIERDAGRPATIASSLIWQMQLDHHFALVAARNLARCLDRWWSGIEVDPVVRAELIEGRDLLEHWEENMPIFNVTPRSAQPPRRSGKDFAARNPRGGPYGFWGWSSKEGPRLLPNVTARALHELLDRVEAAVLERRPELREFLGERPESPWTPGDGASNRHEYWPRGL